MWWKLLAGAVVIALAGLFLWRFGDAKFHQGELHERVAWKDVALEHQKEIGRIELANERRVTTAYASFADREASREPIVLRSKETVTRYAQTPSGRVLCLAPDRVRGIEKDRTALFPSYSFAAPAGIGALPSNANPDR